MENLDYKDIEKRAAEIISETKPKPKVEEKGIDFGSVIEHPLFGNTATALTKTSEYLNAATGWVYACVAAISDEIANINIRLFKVNAKKEPEEVDNHPILDLLYRANPFTTKFDMFWQTQEYLELTGEAPWLLVKDEGTITDILLLRPDLLDIKIVKEGNGIIDRYVYRIGMGEERDIKKEDLIFIKYPNPTKPFRGMGTLQAAAKTVDIDNFSEEFNRVFFANSAMPGSILQTANKLTKETKKYLTKAIDKMYKGTGKAHKAMILENGLEWKPLQLTQKDMDFLNQQNFSRDKIMAIFRVPKTIVGLTEDVNRANAETAAYTFAKWTINPKMQRLIEQLNEFLLPQFEGTENMFLSYDNPIPENVENKLKAYETGLRAGYLTINEVRQMENLEGIGKEGDIVYLPFSLMPIGDISGGRKEESKIIVPKSVMSKVYAKEKDNKIEKKISAEIAPMIKEILLGEIKKKSKKTKEEIYERFWEIMVKKADNFEKIWQKRMDDIFNSQEKETLDKMPKKGVPKKWLLDPEKEKKKFDQKFNPLILAIVKESGKDAFKLIGMEDEELDLTNPIVKKYLEERIFKISDDVNAETNKKLGKTLAEGTEAGESIPALRKRVTTVFGSMKSYRSERIARSEVIRASNFATNESYIQSGVVESKEWLTAMDERVCPHCNAMNGRTVGLKTDFLKNGDTIAGFKVDYESVAAPPLHPSCRCTIVPVIKS